MTSQGWLRSFRRCSMTGSHRPEAEVKKAFGSQYPETRLLLPPCRMQQSVQTLFKAIFAWAGIATSKHCGESRKIA